MAVISILLFKLKAIIIYFSFMSITSHGLLPSVFIFLTAAVLCINSIRFNKSLLVSSLIFFILAVNNYIFLPIGHGGLDSIWMIGSCILFIGAALALLLAVILGHCWGKFTQKPNADN
jgi:hypothetical protein